MTQYDVQDGKRVLRFEGQQLAKSSSQKAHSERWIEFTLYKTVSGVYVLHRLGVSSIFHASTCDLVGKYGLKETENYRLRANALPCLECVPEKSDPLVYPEVDRHWTLTTHDPRAILKALYRPDGSGGQYLTKVAERLLDDASDIDVEIDEAYRVQYLI